MAKSNAVDALAGLDKPTKIGAGKPAAPAKPAPKAAKADALADLDGETVVNVEKSAKASTPKTKGPRVNANALAGKTLVQDAEKCAKLKEGSLRFDTVAAFKGANGAKYETALAKLSSTLTPKRGGRAQNGASEAFASDMIRTMVRLGFLVTK